MRFLADENVPAKLLAFLRSLGHDLRPVLKGTADPALAAQAQAESRVLLTYDTDFSNVDRYPASSHAGIILIRMNPVHIEKAKAVLEDLLTSIPESGLTGRRYLVFEETFMEVKENDAIPFGP
ncbi:MAG: DUF5615 family PIN-like protein [Nitrospirae bacterium]|nr:DUF5615 family PIN-like protein [Nitrospirota bacterium]